MVSKPKVQREENEAAECPWSEEARVLPESEENEDAGRPT